MNRPVKQTVTFGKLNNDNNRGEKSFPLKIKLFSVFLHQSLSGFCPSW